MRSDDDAFRSLLRDAESGLLTALQRCDQNLARLRRLIFNLEGERHDILRRLSAEQSAGGVMPSSAGESSKGRAPE